MQLKTDWGNAKRLPESLFEWLYLWCRERRLRRARIKRLGPQHSEGQSHG